MSSRAICVGLAALAGTAAMAGDDPFADLVLEYDEGLNPAPGYTSPVSVLGPPERFTGEGVFPGVVSPFNPPFLPEEILSIGAGGRLVVQFATPVTDDPGNPFGVDLLIFGNAFFIDAAYPTGVAGALFSDGYGVIEVSADGVEWLPVEAASPEGLYPTLGYLDAGPYDGGAGTVETDFTLPVDPSIQAGDFEGQSYQETLDLYGGSGGGAGIDLAAAGIASACCVRLTNPGDPAVVPSIEIDALSDVAPASNPADIDGNGAVNVIDLLLLLGSFGASCPCAADLDGNGAVDVTDLLMLLARWTL